MLHIRDTIPPFYGVLYSLLTPEVNTLCTNNVCTWRLHKHTYMYAALINVNVVIPTCSYLTRVSRLFDTFHPSYTLNMTLPLIVTPC